MMIEIKIPGNKILQPENRLG